MSDADLDEIRKARLAQLRQQSAASGPASSSPAGAGGEGQEDARAREAEARQAILSQILLPEAADRLGRIRLVKESRATDMENRLIMLARSGQLRSKVTEDQLKDLLGAVSEQEEKTQDRIVVQRRGGWDDDDDLLDL
ncbi:PDCD5-related protein [Phyllosticta citricarpa]|uniref:PDCD5-related protein n=2 Tax=Phyllosticta TaxID=121621 RepID=A0ABR1MRN5_9PEZI